MLFTLFVFLAAVTLLLYAYRVNRNAYQMLRKGLTNQSFEIQMRSEE